MTRATPILFAILLVPSAANAGARQDAKVVLSDNAEERKFQEDWGYADAVVTDDTIYLSGVVAGPRPGETDLKLAYERAFRHIGAVLQRVGASWDDVVDITSFHTDVKAQMPAIVAAKKEFVRNPPPAWTAIQVARLIPDRGITEIKIVAKLPPAKR